MTFYAVGLNKEWVEIRSGPKPPEIIKTKVVRRIKIPKNVYDPEVGIYGGERDLVIETIYFDGGKPLYIIPRYYYLKVMRELGTEAPKTGAVCTLHQPLITYLKNRKWREDRHFV